MTCKARGDPLGRGREGRGGEVEKREAVIDAKERRDVAVIDMPNAFVQTRLEDDDDKVVMRLCGKLAKLMVKVAPESTPST